MSEAEKPGAGPGLAAIEVGLRGEKRVRVDESMTAHAFGNEGVHVLSSPHLANELELACVEAVLHLLPAGSTTVGTELSFKHLAATPVGADVTCRAVLTAVDGRRLSFSIEADDGIDRIAEGSHERYVMESERLAAKIAAKTACLSDRHATPR